jgi:N-acetyl-gamma-glutamyl-phosphate reductase
VREPIRVAVAGATGYTGIELLRWLQGHPKVEVCRLTSEQYAGKRVSDVYPSFRGPGDLRLEPLAPATVGRDVEVVFSCLPHGTAAPVVASALESGATVIDLSADFRLRDVSVFERWYGPHPAPARLGEAVYGLPEFFRAALRGATLVAVPGCYPTGALLGLLPLARAGLIADGTVVVDSKSGASGAGRALRLDLLFCELEEGMRPYGVGGHRHLPEIEQELRRAGVEARVVFTPHLAPLRRGLLSTMYVPVRRSAEVAEAFEATYRSEPFVRLLGPGRFPDVRDVRGTNDVAIGWTELPDAGLAIVVTAIDNLGKGASGQAVQCLNAVYGWDERTGLDALALVP